MGLTRASLQNPAVIAVIAVIVILAGGLSINRLPVQLLPNIERPVVTVITQWPGASPKEIESEINVQLEEVLRGAPGLKALRAWAPPNNSFIEMTFELSVTMDKAMLEVISRLNRLPPLPADADPPVVRLGSWDNTQGALIEFFIQELPGANVDLEDQKRWVENVLVPELEAQPGVASIALEDNTGAGEQLQIEFDPYRAAQYQIELPQITAAVGQATDISGGVIDVGRRKFTLRFEGRYSPEQLSDLILVWRDGRPVLLGDIAEVSIGTGRRDGFMYQNGRPAMMLSIQRESGANVLESLDNLKSLVNELNAGALSERGLFMQHSFDPSVYINRSIGLLTGNLALGVLLAVGALWWFLRQMRATLLIALAIPVSLLSTFILLAIAGRSLNVISLAGLAFATGMVLDAAIVVLENIVRIREEGNDPDTASNRGTGQVWGALVASTSTTVAIFLPILFLREVEGQLFADLALTIAIGVTMSLFVAVTILPVAAKYWLKKLPEDADHHATWRKMAAMLMALTNSNGKRLGWIGGLMAMPILLSWMLLPAMNYLPPVQRDNLDAWMFFPPGASVDYVDNEIAGLITERLEPYLSGEKSPKIENYYIWSWPAVIGATLGIDPADQRDLPAIREILSNDILKDIPGLNYFVQQRSLLGGFRTADGVELQIQSEDLDASRAAAIEAMSLIQQRLPGAAINPRPDPNIQTPELVFSPNDRRLAEVGWRRADFANVVRSLGNGIWLGEHFDGNRRLDIFFKANIPDDPDILANVPLSTPSGEIVPLNELSDIRTTIGPGAIVRFDGRRTNNIDVTPPNGMALEELLEVLQTEIEPQILAMLPANGTVRYGGSADDLDRAVTELGTNFLLALILLFLIMAALFRSPKDAFLVLVSIPLATVGGILMLNLFGLPLDLLSMIGFIILLGLVVNNAILLVVQTRRSEEEGMGRKEAVEHALRLRLRPIFMSTLTSICGMLPLLAIPGEGTEIYRGMAAAIVGGMLVSTMFTLILLPSMLQLGRARKTTYRTAEVSGLARRPAAE